MRIAKDMARWAGLGWRDRALLAEATATLAAASLAIRLFPFRNVVTIAARAPARRVAAQEAEAIVARLRWAVEACGRRLPWRIVCFQKGLALHMMLRRRGIASILHYGVGQNAERGLTAHVWVSVAGAIVIGGEEAASHTCLATFPAAAGA